MDSSVYGVPPSKVRTFKPSNDGPDDAVPRLRRRMRRVRMQYAWRLGAWAAECYLIGALALWVLAGLIHQGLDWNLVQLKPLAWLLVLAWLGGAVAAAAWTRRALPSRGELALRLEAAVPRFLGRLLTGVEAVEHPRAVPPAIAELSAETAVAILEDQGRDAVRPALPWTRTHAWLMSTASILLLCVAFFGTAFLSDFFGALVAHAHGGDWQAPHILEVQPGAAELVDGDTLEVEALVNGSDIRRVLVEVTAPATQAGSADEPRIVELSPVADTPHRWAGSLGVLRHSCRYRVVGMGAPPPRSASKSPQRTPSAWFELQVRPSIQVAASTVLVEPPAYTRQPAQLLKNAAAVDALAGSRLTVQVRVRPANDAAAGSAQWPPNGRADIARTTIPNAEGAYYKVAFDARRSGMIRLAIDPREAHRTPAQQLIVLNVRYDQPPVADARIPDEALPDDEGLPVDLDLRDDVGLARAHLELRGLPPDEVGASTLPPEEFTLEIPFTRLDAPAPHTTHIKERWIVPAERLSGFLTYGFRYRVEAWDVADPGAQRARSEWRTWKPQRLRQARGEPSRVLENRRPRKLARKPDHGGKLNPGNEQLKQMGDIGSGRTPPKDESNKLRRPKAERLDDRPKGSNEVSSGNPAPQPRSEGKAGQQGEADQAQPNDGTGQGSGQKQKGTDGPQGEGQPQPAPPPKMDTGEYEVPQGMEAPKDENQAPQPQPGGESGSGEQGTSGGESPGPSGKNDGHEEQSESKGLRGGKTPRPGGEADDTKPSTQQGPRDGGQANGPAPEGTGETKDEDAADGGTQGPGPKRARDGGPKTGREVGGGSREMAPPDIETLARMKGITLEEAKRFAERTNVSAAPTGFGSESIGRERSANEPMPKNFGEAFKFQTPRRETPKEPGADVEDQTQPLVKPVVEGIDPRFKAWVNAYFRQLEGER